MPPPIRSGGTAQFWPSPFKLFIPDIEADAGQDVVRLLDNRYFAPDELHPRRSYAYVSGPLKTFNDQPELVINSRDHAHLIVSAARPPSAYRRCSGPRRSPR